MALYNRRSQKPVRRRLRSHGTPAEAALWTRLKRRQLGGFRWRRQFGVGPYVLDFYCPATRLAVELDGAVHDDAAAREADAARTANLDRVGIRVLRFENRVVFERPAEVLEQILAACRGGPQGQSEQSVGGGRRPT